MLAIIRLIAKNGKRYANFVMKNINNNYIFGLILVQR